MKILKFWWNFFKELRIFYVYRKATYSIKKELESINMRVDWLGRVYTVINLPEEMINQQDLVKQAWVLKQLREVNDVMLKYGLSDISYPEISPIKGENAYLLVIWPEYEYLTFFRILSNFIFIIFIIFIFKFALKFSTPLMHYIHNY